MPLEHTDHRVPARETSPNVRDGKMRSSRRALLLGVAGVIGASVLTACGSDTSRDAARGREKDASRESVVKELQATETWNLVNGTATPGTPEAGE